MFSFSNFDEVFDFDPDCSYDTIAVQRIEGNRKTLEGLFVDILMKNASIRRPVKYYPPKTNSDLRNLHKAIVETAGEDHVKLSILYYLLLDFDAPTGRRDYSMSFEQRSFLPQKYQIYIKGLWHMDRLDFESALEYLTYPSLLPTFADEILEVLVRHSKHDLAVPLAYYHTVHPTLTGSSATESLFSAIARTSVTEAFYFSRGQADSARRHMFELLISAVLSNSSPETIADRSVELVNLPFTQEEEAWFEDYLLRGEGRAIRKGRDTVMMRRIGMGKFSETLSLKGIGGRSVGGLDWDRLSAAVKEGLGPRIDV
ncbi:ELYS-like domain protein [Rutstroemia sp. NJR-2017a BVV2]|nr:ELYS-like domain protein [Rutstroemia sp. NJR-2017a BVV2]